jgi:hypothetical protein
MLLNICCCSAGCVQVVRMGSTRPLSCQQTCCPTSSLFRRSG